MKREYTLEEQMQIIEKGGWNCYLEIDKISNPIEELQIKAVQENSIALVYIENPSEAVQLEAVKQDGEAIQYIKNPSEVVQFAAVKQNGEAIMFIENPSFETIYLAIKNIDSVDSLTIDLKNLMEYIKISVKILKECYQKKIIKFSML